MGIIKKSEASNHSVEIFWHLRAQDVHLKDFWLDLEMCGSTSLLQLDKYLRFIWLECCNHLSMYTIGGWGGKEIGKSRKANEIFKPHLILRHLYDYGTTSETDIRVIGSRKGRATTKHPIVLLARNNMPEAFCQECGQIASWMCTECQYEDDMPGLLCDDHVVDHPHEDYGEPSPLVNSPRMGMCGYDGPAEPPY